MIQIEKDGDPKHDMNRFLQEKVAAGANILFTGQSEQAILTAIQSSLAYIPNDSIIFVHEQSLQLEIAGEHPISNIRRLIGLDFDVNHIFSLFDIGILPDIQTESQVASFALFSFTGKQVIGGNRCDSPLDALETFSTYYQKRYPDLSIETARQMMTLPIQFIVSLGKGSRRLDHQLQIFELVLEKNKDVIMREIFLEEEQTIPLTDQHIQFKEMV